MKTETLKKIVELGEGFEWDGDCEPSDDMITFRDGNYIMHNENLDTWSGPVLYPLLLRRAVEGWNDKHDSIVFDPLGILSIDNDEAFEYHNFQKTEYLTPQEQAIEACLIELLEEEE